MYDGLGNNIFLEAFLGGTTPRRVAQDYIFGSNDISHISLLQGHRLSHSPEDGIIFTNFSLVLQRINQSQAGKYMCESSNRVGKERSENIFLDVKCKIISSLFYPSGAFINNITTVFLYL